MILRMKLKNLSNYLNWENCMKKLYSILDKALNELYIYQFNIFQLTFQK